MSQKKKTTAQSKRPRKAPSNQTGGTAWGKKAAAAISGKMQSADVKKLILLNFPYIIAFYMVEKAAWLYRYCNGDTIVDRLMVLFMNFGLAYKSYLPSFHPFDLLVGLIGAAALKAVIYFKGRPSMPFSISASVRVSMLDVASSKISTGGSATAARAMASSWRWPWLRLAPSEVTIVSYPWGRR